MIIEYPTSLTSVIDKIATFLTSYLMSVEYSLIWYTGFNRLTLKHRETHGCVVSTVATDALVLKHQTISIHNAD